MSISASACSYSATRSGWSRETAACKLNKRPRHVIYPEARSYAKQRQVPWFFPADSMTIDFDRFFHRITDHLPHEYQKEMAKLPVRDCLIRVPTGCGKTAAVIGAWLWRRQEDPARTSTRLVYCLPMRVLVEQTRDLAKVWARKSETGAKVYTLMGGEIDEDWEFDPDKPAILVGTQDMLLSRSLNRGYAMSRYRWPAHFGLLNNDCLWVCDEVQLMGNGLGTTAQLQAFRQKWGTYGPVATCWMSATADREWLKTVDYQNAPHIKLVELGKTDRDSQLRS